MSFATLVKVRQTMRYFREFYPELPGQGDQAAQPLHVLVIYPSWKDGQRIGRRYPLEMHLSPCRTSRAQDSGLTTYNANIIIK